MKLPLLALAALPLLAGCGPRPEADPDKPESYAARWTVEPEGTGADQQLSLPADVLLALHSSDLADLRLFDGTGRALPLAVHRAVEDGSRVIAPPAYPVLGRQAPSDGGVALVIGPDQVARVVGVTGEPGEERQVALLVDTRGVAGAVLSVRLAVDLPLQKPVTFGAAASDDLQTWEPIGAKTLFRTDASGNQLDAADMPLGGISLKGRYLQITWDPAEGVTVTGAQVTERLAAAPALLPVETTGARLESPRDLRFSLPVRHLPEAIVVALAGGEGVVPVQLLTRANPEQAWQVLRGGTLGSGAPAGDRLPLGGAPGPEFRLLADDRTPGFAAVPRITLQFEPVMLLTRLSGKPPYTLAAGMDGAPPQLLSASEILPQGDPSVLPEAKVLGGLPALVDIGTSRADAFDKRKAVLWLVLAAGVAVLGFAVLRLLRGSGGTDS